MAEHNTDERILLLCTDGTHTEEGFNLLMKTYGKRLYWHIRRMVVGEQDAEDVLQETCINIFRFIGSFKSNSRLYTWLYTIATRECIRHLRKNKRKVEWLDEGSEWLVNTLYAENSPKAETILYKFHQAILQLPEKQRLVFNLRYFDGLSYEEIGTITSSTVGSLKTNYHYAFEKIKTILSHGI